MTLIAAALVDQNADATIRWTQGQKEKVIVIPAAGRGRKVCELLEADLGSVNFRTD